jgi:hypothetical protein
MADRDPDFDQDVRRIVTAVLTELRPMPVPYHGTAYNYGGVEIIIRLGPQVPALFCPDPCVPPGEFVFGAEVEALIQRILQTRSISRAQLIQEVLTQALAPGIEKYAADSGVSTPEPPQARRGRGPAAGG